MNLQDINIVADAAAEPWRQPYKKAWLTLISLIGIIAVMWVINIIATTGYLPISLNFPVMLGAGLAIWYLGISPIMHAYGIGAGGLWSLVSWKSPKAGISDSLHLLYSAVLLVFFVFLLSGIVLSTVYFGHNPMAFWALAFITLALIIASKLLETGGAVVMAITVIGTLLLFAASWIFNVSIVMPGNQDAAAAELWNDAKKRVTTASTEPATIECPKDRKTLMVVYDTRVTVPMGCDTVVKGEVLQGIDIEYEFADETLPVKNGERLLNGRPLRHYLTHSYAYEGREGAGMLLTTTNSKRWQEANVTEIEVVFLKKGTMAKVPDTAGVSWRM